MQCRDLKELLSAYADSELSSAQKEFIEKHLAGCADCRATLAGYQAVNQKLTSLREVPAVPDRKDAIMAKIKGMSKRPVQRWLRPALAAIPVVAVLIAITVLQPWTPGPQTVMAKAYAAVERLQSYRTWHDYTIKKYNGEASSIVLESEFVTPDRYHIKTIEGNLQKEAILLDKRLFIKSGSMSKDIVTALMVTSSTFLTKETALNILNELINIEKLPDEKIDGVECFHYRGTLDMNKESEQIKSGLDASDPNYERLLADAEQMRSMYHDVELWIGKEDYLVRQIVQSYQLPATSRQFLPEEVGQRNSYTSIMKFFDLNKPITISPFTATGDLLPGWEEVSNSSFSQPVFTVGSSINVGGENPAHQQISFKFYITNTKPETISNIKVTLVTMATNELNKPVTLELEPTQPGPISLKQFEKETFSVTWEYDASQISDVDLDKLIQTTTVLARYTSPYGIEKTEQLYPDTRYSTKTPSSKEIK